MHITNSRKFYALCFAVISNLAIAQTENSLAYVQITPERTETHNVIVMQYMLVGGFAERCQQPLSKSSTFASETVKSWAEDNKKYLVAYSKYREALIALISSQKGAEGVAMENKSHRQIIAKQANTLINQSFANRDTKIVCEQFEQRMVQKAFDIGPNFPFFVQANELLQAVGE